MSKSKKLNFGFVTPEVVKFYDAGSIDLLKYIITPAMLSTFVIFIMGKQYVGQSVQCWAPAQFEDSWEQYIETYCLIENTYFANMNDTNLPAAEQRENLEMKYYQWVPFILFGLAVLLISPRVLYSFLNSIFVDADFQVISKYLSEMAKETIDADVTKFENRRKPKRKTKRNKWGTNLTKVTLATKIVSTAVVVICLVFMDLFVKLGSFFGLTVIMDLLSGRQWPQSGAFPRVTFCDVEVRELGQLNRWSLQCVLMVNMFNEKLFVFLWWWFVMLFFVSIYDIVEFLANMRNSSHKKYIKQLLEHNDVDDYTEEEINEFVGQVIKSDGVTVLRHAETYSSPFHVAEYIRPLWENFRNEKDQ